MPSSQRALEELEALEALFPDGDQIQQFDHEGLAVSVRRSMGTDKVHDGASCSRDDAVRGCVKFWYRMSADSGIADHRRGDAASVVLELEWRCPEGYLRDDDQGCEDHVVVLEKLRGARASSAEVDAAGVALRALAQEAAEQGVEVLFTWIEALHDLHSLLARRIRDSTVTALTAASQADEQTDSPVDSDSESDSTLPETRWWTSAEPIVDRKSKFLGYATPLFSPDDVKMLIEELRAHGRKVSSSTHVMTAFRCQVFDPSGDIQMAEERDDDGETGAGDNMLTVLRQLDAVNVLTVVVRWYGGVQLGPDRFKHIRAAAREVTSAVQEFQQSSKTTPFYQASDIFISSDARSSSRNAPRQLESLAPTCELFPFAFPVGKGKGKLVWPSLRRLMWALECGSDLTIVEKIRSAKSLDDAQDEYYGAVSVVSAGGPDTGTDEALIAAFAEQVRSHPKLRGLLLATRTGRLHWDHHDAYYGYSGLDKWGQNIAMRVREQLRIRAEE